MFTFHTIAQQVINGLLTGSIYILVALGLTLVFGIYRMINLTHGAVYMWGAYFCHILALKLGMNFFLATFLAMLLSGVLSVAIERSIFRSLKGQADWIILIAGLGLYTALANFGWIVLGPRELHIHAPATQTTLRLFGFYANSQKLIMAGICLFILVALIIVLKKTDIGRAMRAASVDAEGAQLIGVNTERISMIVFFIGGAFAALAGSFYGSLTSVNPAMGWGMMIIAFIIVVFGGMGSIIGTIIAALLVGIIQNILAFAVAPMFAKCFTFIILLLVFIVKPTGIFGEKQ